MWHTYRPTYFSHDGDYYKNCDVQKQTFIEKKIPDYGEADEFFDLIVEKNIRVVVLLEKICWEDPNVCERSRYYWEPSSREAKNGKKYKFIKSKVEYRNGYNLISVRIDSRKVLHDFKVFRYQLISEDVPSSIRSFINFLTEARNANCPIDNRTIAPIVVHSDGGVALADLIVVIEIGMDSMWFSSDTKNIQEFMPSMKQLEQKQIEFCQMVFAMYAKKLGITFDKYYSLFFTLPLSSSLYTYWSHTLVFEVGSHLK